MKNLFLTFFIFLFSFSLWAEDYTLRIVSKLCKISDVETLTAEELFKLDSLPYATVQTGTISIPVDLDKSASFSNMRDALGNMMFRMADSSEAEKEKFRLGYAKVGSREIGAKAEVLLKKIDGKAFLAKIDFDYTRLQTHFGLMDDSVLYPLFERNAFTYDVLFALDRPEIINMQLTRSFNKAGELKHVALVYFATLSKKE